MGEKQQKMLIDIVVAVLFIVWVIFLIETGSFQETIPLFTLSVVVIFTTTMRRRRK